jgi:hypothetical protein
MKCTNSHPGTFGHECGKPADRVGVQNSKFSADGLHRQPFCSKCAVHGYEARTVVWWEDLDGNEIKH